MTCQLCLRKQIFTVTSDSQLHVGTTDGAEFQNIIASVTTLLRNGMEYSLAVYLQSRDKLRLLANYKTVHSAGCLKFHGLQFSQLQ